MADHAEHGVDNPAFDGGTEVTRPIDPRLGCTTDQNMSKARKDDTGQEQRNPLLGQDTSAAEAHPPAEPVGRKSSSQEISKFFEHGAKKESEKKGIREGFYTDDNQAPQRYKVDESDYESHRTTDFPHIHPILGSMHPVQVKKPRKASHGSAVAPSLPDVTEDPSSDSEQRRHAPSVPYIMSAPDLELRGIESLTTPGKDDKASPQLQKPPPHPGSKGEYTILPAVTLPQGRAPGGTSETDGDGVTFLIGDEMGEDTSGKLGFLSNLGQDPSLSGRGNVTPKVTSPHVKFSLGSTGSLDRPASEPRLRDDAMADLSDDPSGSERNKDKARKKHSGAKSHHHHKRPQELAMRRHRGSDLKMAAPRMPTEHEEASTLVGSDLAEMSAHRLHDIRGMRRHLISPNAMLSIGKSAEKTDDIKPNLILPRRLFDHQPHEMFVELDELLLTKNEEYEWQEKARWIKFEEDVEENLSRWGKPHVASLSFHSLLELRQCIEHGVILLDLEEEDLPSIVTRLVDQLVTDDLLDPEQKGLIIRALLLKHRHVGEGGFALRRPSTANMLSHGESTDPEVIFRRSRPSMMNFFRSSSVVNQKATSPYVLRKADLNGSVGSNLNTLPENSSSTSLPATVQLNSQGQKNRDHVYLDISSENQNVKNKNINNLSQSHAPKVSFTVPDVVSGEKVPLGDDDGSIIKDIHTIHTGAPVLTSRGSVASLTSETGSTRTEQETGQSNILRRIPKGAEATTVLVGNVELLSQPIMAFVRLSEGRYLNNVTEVNIPVRFIFLLMGPSTANLDYHEIGRSISTLMANTSFHEVAYRAEDRIDLMDAINEFLDESIVLPPGEWDRETLLPIMDMQKKKKEERREREKAKKVMIPDEPDEKRRNPLTRTGRFFGGVIDDIKQRYPFYLSDLKDGLNLQCLSAFFFIYFAALSPAITFGGLLTEKTHRWMGVTEMILASSCFGTIFSLIAGQPITVAGFTGPLLVFEEGLYSFSESVGLEYMPFRFWSLMWMAVITLVCVCFEGGMLVKYITRFTEEIFALLISLIFIIETFLKLASIFNKHPLLEYYPPPWCDTPPQNLYTNGTNSSLLDNDTMTTMMSMTTMDPLDMNRTTPAPLRVKPTNQPNTALLSLVLCLATFVLATELKKFRNSKFLGRSARRALGDFGVPISILIFVLVDFLIQDTYTEKLDVPDGISPTDPSKRGWFINPLGLEKNLPVWAMFAGIIPGLLIFILIFMETQITSIILNKPERNLKKGSGFHLDFMLLGVYALFAGLIGLPVLSGATVRSVSHISALSVYSRTHAPGDKPKLERVYEQRITGLCVHILLGLSLLLGPVLRRVPLAVLFGVFLYMGISSLAGLQLFDRISFLFMPRKYHGDASYVRKVKPLKMHLFTIIQVIILGVLWAVKSTAASLAFPFLLILTVPLRYFILKFVFNPVELGELDNSGASKDEKDDEPDFYEQAHTLPSTDSK